MRRPIAGYDGYFIDANGTVISTKYHEPRVLKTKLSKGYPKVCLSRPGEKPKWRPVHLLVLETFVGPRPEGLVARHRNGNAADPRLSNLTWGTQSENLLDKRQHGTDHNGTKIKCVNGHPYDEVNTFWRKDRPGQRQCRACNRAAQRRRAKRGKADSA